jgi:CubicO group peptidase (beta-lactamase class C family)
MNTKKILEGSLLAGGVLALLRLAFAVTASAKPALETSSYTAIDTYLEGQMQRLAIPGAALAVVEGDRIVHMRGFGRDRPGGKVPLPHTPFFIGSLTKSFTALALMQLVEAGKVELDAPVQCYLPWFHAAPPRGCLADAPASTTITVRHLLNQTSGLPMSAGMKTLANEGDKPNPVMNLARTLSTIQPSHPAGEVCEYCNLNYDLIGLIIEAASGVAYADYVQNHIFNPLGMSHSYTSKTVGQQNGLAVGHRYWFGIPIPAPNLPVPQESIASGQLISCSEDMARYLAAHLNGGRCGDVQILSESGMETLHLGAKEYIMLGISSGRYAMGWFVEETGQAKTLSHGGNVPEYSAYMGFLPEQKKGLVLLINADHYGLPPILGEVGWGATALLAGKQPGPIHLGFIPWVMRALALIPLLQIFGLITTLRSVRSWRRNPALRQGRERIIGQHLLLPLIPDLALSAIPIYFLSKKMLGYLRLFMPDVYWTALISGGFAGIWAFVRTGLILRNLRRPPA